MLEWAAISSSRGPLLRPLHWQAGSLPLVGMDSPENPHGQRNLEGYSPWGHRESDMTEHLSLTQP